MENWRKIPNMAKQFDEIIKEIKDEMKNKNLPLIISGAGVVGEVLLSICREQGIKVECFCDASKKVSLNKFCDLDVVYTPDLLKKYKDAIFLISVVAIKDVVDILHESGYSKWYAGGTLLKNLDIAQNESLIDYTKFAIENCILCHEAYLNPDKLFFRSIDLIITERCSLRCKDCSNLMQYYKNPKDCDINLLLKSVDVFFKVIDEVMDFRVIGGDVFMNREWYKVVERLLDEPKAKRIVLYTNGTIVPNEEYIPLLKNHKVLTIITNYGILSRNLEKLKEIFNKNNISYNVLNVTEWLDCSKIEKRNRTVKQNMEIFKVCCAKNMPTLSDGKIFRCPYSANAFRLLAVPDYKNDYIDLFEEAINNKNINKIKNKVKEFILNKDYLGTCDFCNGRPLSGTEVRPATQASKPLEYYKYR